jgi:rod shape-determining protein MreC
VKKRPLTKTDALNLSWRDSFARFYFLILILIASTLLIYSQISTQVITVARTYIMDITVPFIETVSEPFATASNALGQMTNIHTLRAENIQLVEENERLRQWYETALRLNAENQSLRDLLNFKKDENLSYLTTRIISDTSGSFVKTFIIPIGQKDGLAPGQAVLSKNGMIGRIIEVGQNSARVLLVTDLNSRIPVLVQGTRQKAILAGQNSDIMRLEHLPRDSSVSVGDHIITSGHGGVLPPNLPIGIVSAIKDGQAFIKPIINIETLSFVQIVKNKPDFIDGQPF